MNGTKKNVIELLCSKGVNSIGMTSSQTAYGENLNIGSYNISKSERLRD